MRPIIFRVRPIHAPLAAAAALGLLCAAGCSDSASTPADTGGEAIIDIGARDAHAEATPDGPGKPDVSIADGQTDTKLVDGSADGGAVDALAVQCPPPGPFGNTKGKMLPNLTLKDCAGTNHDIFDLCGKKASWIFIFRGA